MHKNTSLKKRLHTVISGRVQGVGFRWFVIQQARPLNLNGWVKNLYNGDVEVMAEGPKPDLEFLLEKLRKGPTWSHVDHVDVEWLDPSGMTGGFDVKY